MRVNKLVKNYFFYGSSIILKIVNFFIKQGKQEKMESKVLNIFKFCNFYIVIFIIWNFLIPFNFYIIKKRFSRNTFVYCNTLAPTNRVYKYNFAIKQFCKLFINEVSRNPKNGFSEVLANSLLENFFTKWQRSKVSVRGVELKRKVLARRGLKHFRWKIKTVN